MATDTRIVAPDSGVVSLDEVRAEKAEEALRRTPGNLSDFVTRREMIKGVTNAAMAMGEKMYEQFSDETADHLTRMEDEIFTRVVARLEQRSLYGRLRVRWSAVRALVAGNVLARLRAPSAPSASEAVSTTPRLTAELVAELRRRIEAAGPDDTITIPEGTTFEDADRIHALVRAERAAAAENPAGTPA